MRQQVKELSAI